MPCRYSHASSQQHEQQNDELLAYSEPVAALAPLPLRLWGCTGSQASYIAVATEKLRNGRSSPYQHDASQEISGSCPEMIGEPVVRRDKAELLPSGLA